MNPPTSQPVPTIGLLQLATRFPRPVGDIGCAESFPGARLQVEIVDAATVARVVRGTGPDAGILPAFIAARDRLVAQGASLITTSCGFLAPWQAALERDCPVPVLTSSLWELRRFRNNRQVGVITYDEAALQTLWPTLEPDLGPAPPILGLAPDDHLRLVISRDEPTLDVARAQRELTARVLHWIEGYQQVETLLLECTNLGPYATALRTSTQREVISLTDLVRARLQL